MIVFLVGLMTLLIPIAKRMPAKGVKRVLLILLVSLTQICIVVIYLYNMHIPSDVAK